MRRTRAALCRGVALGGFLLLPAVSGISAQEQEGAAQKILPEQTSEAAACDQFAAYPSDRDRPSNVVGVEVIPQENVPAAVAACQSAVSASAPLAGDPSRRFGFQLGRALEAGGRPTAALKAYESAAQSGSTLAMVSLAILRLTSDEVPRNPEEALRLLKAAAEAGEALAMTNLGSIHGSGTGVSVDIKEARRWYGMAAEAGDPEAMYQLGLLDRDGDGAAPDDQRAKQWFEKAAAKRHPDAMLELGQFAEAGRAGPKDLVAAKHFYEMAAALGNSEAKDHARRLQCAFVLKDKSGKTVGTLCAD